MAQPPTMQSFGAISCLPPANAHAELPVSVRRRPVGIHVPPIPGGRKADRGARQMIEAEAEFTQPSPRTTTARRLSRVWVGSQYPELER